MNTGIKGCFTPNGVELPLRVQGLPEPLAWSWNVPRSFFAFLMKNILSKSILIYWLLTSAFVTSGQKANFEGAITHFSVKTITLADTIEPVPTVGSIKIIDNTLTISLNNVDTLIMNFKINSISYDQSNEDNHYYKVQMEDELQKIVNCQFLFKEDNSLIINYSNNFATWLFVVSTIRNKLFLTHTQITDKNDE